MSLTPEQEKALETAIQKLQTGSPLPYVLGHWEFFGLDFNVTPEVLIPRPETELLIETALAETRTHPRLYPRFLDVGTGSGIIPVTLATHVLPRRTRGNGHLLRALEVARANAERHGVAERIRFTKPICLDERRTRQATASVFGLSSFDLILTNLPYIPSETLQGLEVFGKEPTLALDGGPDGMDLIRRLLAQSKRWLASGGTILLEIENRQGHGGRNGRGKRSLPPTSRLKKTWPGMTGFCRLLLNCYGHLDKKGYKLINENKNPCH